MNTELLLYNLSDRFSNILKDNFVGMYVHGSYAMGCFNPSKSDLDFIIVCHDEPDTSAKKNIMDVCLEFEQVAPAKGLEMHLMRLSDCLNITRTPAFCLHHSRAHIRSYLSNPHGYASRMRGFDPDLGAHLMIMRRRGLRISGPEIPHVFGEVPAEHYARSILHDLSWSADDAMYHVLNYCRSLAYAREGSVLSKKEGAVWAMEHVPEEYLPMIRRALLCYRSNETFTPEPAAERFCEYALSEVKKLLSFS